MAILTPTHYVSAPPRWRLQANRLSPGLDRSTNRVTIESSLTVT